MTPSRALKTLALVAVISLVAAGLPGPVTVVSYAAAQDPVVPPDMASWSSTPASDPAHSSMQQAGSPAHGAQNSAPFIDIATHWAKSDIEALYQRGIITGDGSGKFDPERHITRAELTKMLVTVAHVPAASSSTSKDKNLDLSAMKKDAWYYPYVTSAVSAGIIRAMDGKFYPDSHTTREVFAAMTVRAAGKEQFVPATASAAGTFADYNQISAWARGYVGMVKELGLMQGDGGMIIPQAPVTRAEAAAIIMRVLRLDLTQPTVRVAGTGANTMTLEFSEPVDRATAEALNSYEIAGLKITAAKLQINGKSVKLTTDRQTVGRTYQLKVKNVRDKAWNAVTPVTVAFGASTGPVASKAVYKDSRHIDVLFNKDLTTEGSVQITVVNKATGKAFGGPYTLEAEGKTLHIMLSADMAPGVTYHVALAGVRDKSGAEMASTMLDVTVSSAQLPPAVVKTAVTGANSFEVLFSKPISSPGAYTAPGFLSATPSFVGTDHVRVRVTVTTSEPDGNFRDRTAYTVTIQDVADADGRKMADKTVQISYTREKVAPTIQSVRAVGPTAIEVVFSEPVEEWSATALSNYNLVRENTASFFTWSGSRSPFLSQDGKTLRLYLDENAPLTSGARYTLTVASVLDLTGNALQTVSRTFAYTGDTTVIGLPVAVDESLSRVTSGNTLEVVFTNPVDPATGRALANYVIARANDPSARLSIISAEIAATDLTHRTVKLVTSPITSDLQVTVRNVKDTSGTIVVPTVINLQQDPAYRSAVTSVRYFNNEVELVLSDSIDDFPDVRIFPTGTTEPATPIADVTLIRDGLSVVVPYDFGAQGDNAFATKYTVKVSGGGLIPGAFTITPQKDTTAPSVTSVATTDRNRVAITFSEEVKVPLTAVSIGATTLTPVTVGPASTWIFTVPGAGLPVQTLQTVTIAAGTVRDRSGLELADEIQQKFTVYADLIRPVVKTIVAVGADKVKVTFSEPVALENSSFQVARAGTAVPVTILAADQPAPDQVLLTLDLTPSATQDEYILTIPGGVFDMAAVPNEILPTSARFRVSKLATRAPAFIELAQAASPTRTEILVADNAAGQQDRIQGEAGAVEANAYVMVYIDGQLEVVTRASANGAFGPVAIGDYDAPREVRVVVVDGEGNTAEASTLINFSR